ncbi:hypothetical protein MesoLjLc_38440 [Mesorhizobium sp. L-8-10]|nr:hypothetical protein MesoLjLb_39660 [Mesorhizobium sp. L-8-3]BCH31914.1 hypothetical protein MesoLjLc_38440 [Mesorhizobium sp. L-8-10]
MAVSNVLARREYVHAVAVYGEKVAVHPPQLLRRTGRRMRGGSRVAEPLIQLQSKGFPTGEAAVGE